MRVKNLGNVLKELKPLLKQYLEDNNTRFTKTHFQCPNRKEHDNEDEQVACNFYPDENHFKCFVCQENGDIFNACHLLEGRPIGGKGFIYDNVLYLADKYNIKYQLSEETNEEKLYTLYQKFIKKLIETSNKYLIEQKPQKAIKYLKKRKWTKIVKTHQLGYFPNSEKAKKAFNKLYNKLIRKTKKINKEAVPEEILSLSFKSIANRLLYPINNSYGLTIAISTREVDDSYKKYTHHPIKLSKKPINLMYNLDRARHYTKVYLVEGASSIFTLSLNGVNNAVSILGSNFIEKHYEWLLKNDIKELVLCFDGDKAGNQALQKAIRKIQNKSEIKIYIKQLPKDKDPDDFIMDKGIKEFMDLEELPLLDYLLDKYKDNQEDNQTQDAIFGLISSQDNNIIKENLIETVAKETNTLKTTLLKELEKYENKNKLMQGISLTEYIEEAEQLEKDIDKFDELRWRTGDLIGLKTTHQFFDEKMDGLQIGLHMVGGKWNVGKSAFCLDLAMRLIQDENNYVIYFSIDDPAIFKTIPRMVANQSKADVNLIVKPKFGIEQNETLSEDEKTDITYNVEQSINKIRDYSKRFSLKDAKSGQSLDFILRKIRLCKQRALDLGNKNLIVFIDFLHMISFQNKEETEKLIHITKELKRATSIYECPIVTTVMGTKSGMEKKSLADTALKGTVELQYEADTINLLETDFYDEHGKMYFYDEEGDPRPIISLNITKNKVLSGFKGKLFYRFYAEQMRFEECAEEEQDKFRKKA